MGYFPRESEATKLIDKQINEKIEKLAENKKEKSQEQLLNTELEEMYKKREFIRQEDSYIGRLGKAIEPVISPLGFDWKMGVSILAGVAAKEIVVSTLGVLYQADKEHENSAQGLMNKIRKETYRTGKRKGELVFTPITALAFLVFILIYFPCIATLAAIKNESGSWKWAAFTLLYTTGLAWFLSFIVYQVGSLVI